MPNKAGLDDTVVLPKPALHSTLKAPHAVVNVSLSRHFVMYVLSLAPYLSTAWRPGWKEPRSHGGRFTYVYRMCPPVLILNVFFVSLGGDTIFPLGWLTDVLLRAEIPDIRLWLEQGLRRGCLFESHATRHSSQ